MEWKRRFELLAGLATASIGVIVVLGTVHEDQQTAQNLGDPSVTGKAFVVAMILYGVPTLLVALGAFTHAMKRRSWAIILLILSTMFLVGWFCLSFAVLV
jgi:hypothetical protein